MAGILFIMRNKIGCKYSLTILPMMKSGLLLNLMDSAGPRITKPGSASLRQMPNATPTRFLILNNAKRKTITLAGLQGPLELLFSYSYKKPPALLVDKKL